MLTTRLIVGSLLAAAAGGVMLGDGYLRPYFPFLALCLFLLAVGATREFVELFPVTRRPSWPGLFATVVLLLAIPWFTTDDRASVAVLTGAALAAMAGAVCRYDGSVESTPRLAALALGIIYLGVLPSYFVRLRFAPTPHGALPFALAIFVPKVGDIGAYAFGRLFGRRKFAPTLSPKKTWEGTLGGIASAAGLAVVVELVHPIFPHGLGEAVAFGSALGTVGVIGDLFESLLKRDAGRKDASRNIPGFGGVLDVVDSVIFSAPLSYFWLTGR